LTGDAKVGEEGWESLLYPRDVESGRSCRSAITNSLLHPGKRRKRREPGPSGMWARSLSVDYKKGRFHASRRKATAGTTFSANDGFYKGTKREERDSEHPKKLL